MHAVLQWLGVISLGMIVVLGVLPLTRKPLSADRSVSQSWGETRHIHLLMGAILTIAGAGFCVFIIGWLIPTYHLASYMHAVTIVAYLAVLAVAWTPITEKPGEHSFRHPHFVGGALGATVIALSYVSILVAHQHVPPVGYGLSLIALVYSMCWPLFFTRRALRYFLILECLFVLLFLLVILSLTAGW